MIVVQFLVPVYDRDRRPYSRDVQKRIQRELEDRFDGWSLASDQPLPGAWRNPESGEVEYDQSWRYEVGVLRKRLSEVDEYLAVLARRLQQKAIWRVVYGRGAGKAIGARSAER